MYGFQACQNIARLRIQCYFRFKRVSLAENFVKIFSEIQATLSASKNDLVQKNQVQEMGIFGFYVKNTQTEHGDLDVLVDFENVPSLCDLVGLCDELSDLLEMKVDLVMKNTLKPRIGQRILQEVVLL